MIGLCLITPFSLFLSLYLSLVLTSIRLLSLLISPLTCGLRSTPHSLSRGIPSPCSFSSWGYFKPPLHLYHQNKETCTSLKPSFSLSLSSFHTNKKGSHSEKCSFTRSTSVPTPSSSSSSTQPYPYSHSFRRIISQAVSFR